MKAIYFVLLLFLSAPAIAQDEIPDVDAKFPGGQQALARFIQENVRYPFKAYRKNLEAKVYVIFFVEKDGTITSVKAVNGPKSLRKEAVRVVSLMPDWSPGELNGHPVRTRCTLPIVFTINID